MAASKLETLSTRQRPNVDGLTGSVDVVVVSSTSFAIVVRELAQDADIPSKSALNVPGLQTARGQAPDNRDSSTTSVPLHGPGFWLDRVNAIWLGAILWTAIASLLLLSGKPFSFEVLFLPLGGASSGAIFQYFTRGARDLEGAYSDHRPAAYIFAVSMLIGAAIGVSAALAMGAGIGIISGGLVLGTLCGALLYLVGQMV